MKYKLYDYQREAVEFHIKKRYSINAFYMGLGKTLVAIDMVNKLNSSTLIVCPGYLQKVWRDEIEKFADEPSNITVTSYSSFKKYKDKFFDVLILDEAHYIKTPTAIRSKTIEKFLEEKYPNYVLLMTGTPAKNDVSEVYNLLNFIRILTPMPEFNFWNQMAFKNYFMKKRKVTTTNHSFWKYYGTKNMAFLKKIIAPVYLRKKLGEVELPPIVNKKIIGSSVKFDRIIKKSKEEEERAYMTIKKDVALHSTDATLKLIEDFPKDEQVIIFTEHIAAAEKLAEKLSVPPITGKVLDKERFSIIDSFKRGHMPYLVMTYKTGSTGHTLVNCNYMVFNDLPFVPADLEQAKKRIHRIGQTTTCFYYYMFVSDFFDEIYSKLLQKAKYIKELD